MRLKLILLLFSLAWNLAVAQNHNRIDSLKQALTLAQSDEDKVMVLSDLSYEYLGAETDSALLLAQQAHDLAQKINFTRGEARALYHLGHAYRIMSDIPNAMRASLRGVQLAEENGFRQEAALCNYNTGALYMGLLNDYPKALGYFKKARQWNSPVQGAIGESCRLTLDINYGTVYKRLNIPDSAEFYYNEALAHTADPNMRLVILNFKGLLQLKLKNYPEALALLREAIAKKINHRASAEMYFNLASCFREMGQIDSCLFYAKNSLTEAEQIGYQQYTMKAATMLAEIYEGENNPEAFRFFKTAKLANEAVYGEQKVQDLQRIITEEMQRQQDSERERTAYENRVRQLALLGGLAVVLLVAFLLYRNNRQKQKTNARLQAQNRELEIEAALERVRARTMAMHKTDELRSVIATVFEQVQTLGFDATACGLTLFNKEDKSMVLWLAGFETDSYPKSYHVPYFDHPLYNAQFGAWEKGQTYQVFKFDGELKKSYDELIFELGDFKNLPSSASEAILSIETATNCTAFMKYGMLESVMTGDEVLTDQQANTLQRFAKVFEQTYTRFLDLQRAEAQAREAQIQAALERVRAQTMAMHKSQDLSEVVNVLFQQVEVLKVDLGCNINLFDRETQTMNCWMAGTVGEPLPKSYPIAGIVHPNVAKMWESWKNQGPPFCIYSTGEAHKDYKNAILETPGYKLLPEEFKEYIRTNTEAYFTFINMPCGQIQTVTAQPLSENNIAILQRFAAVFQQTYTRFLDIQKAEAQAREAKIDAGLERVRAEIASMRSPDDLQRITPLVWRELTTLGVPFFRCGVFIIDEAAERVHAYLSTPEGKPLGVLHLPFDGAETTRQTVAHWRRGEVYTDFWDRQQFLAWVRSMTEQGFVQESTTYQGGEEPPESLALQFVPFTQGMLYVGSTESLPDEQIDLLRRLADTFAVAYARYEDFIQLEEAKKRMEFTLTELKATQAQLIQQEKLASLGQLTAGIAHEIKNPLNFVNNFSEVSKELLEELREEIKKGNWEEVEVITGDLEGNLARIHNHGRRADGIVQAMLLHSRDSSGGLEPTDLNAFVDEYVNLAYHGMRAGKEPINVTIDLDLDEQMGQIAVVVEDFSRVILNLCNNAFDAMREKLRAENDYQPQLTIRTRRADGHLRIEMADNGPGIPEAIREKIFQPFFTTKKGTAGTGLGLSISHDIVKAHGGTLRVESEPEQGSTFIITLNG